MDRVDILTGTLGKALGGASGGYVAAHQEIVDLVHEDQGAELLGQVADLIQRGVGAVHGEDAVGHDLFGVMDRVDILTGTLGKALGGASGGYVAAHQEIVPPSPMKPTACESSTKTRAPNSSARSQISSSGA
jgi:cystathionine beta-lyase family protein involved in aluminum resistance